ncbi:putative two-component membrane permease complex subunit [Ruminiclostridium hungatei]|uniref:Putative two-component membrane permease complex subunit n=1 Tax=Ruminiclostridium hungatei TaxID=48256 RepID=A0A1V4SLW5_RUMHU|nr:TIGR03943 family protein [Ruminiclostridium hungatei]OPX44475.1 putative two-component membrane permease complex subunit [Ruminiclostridium hungatei]
MVNSPWVRINLDALLRIAVLSGFALFFFILVQNGRILLYVNPRIVPYVKFGSLVMAVTALFFIKDVFKPKRKINITPYLFFLIPLLFAFLLPAKSLDSTAMAFGDVEITSRNANAGNSGAVVLQNSETTDTPDYSASDFTDSTDSDSTAIEEDGTAGLDPAAPVIVNDADFVYWLQEINYNMEKYEGREVEVTGFVFKSKEFSHNEFVPARLMMACCTADLQPVGLLCRYDKAAELPQDTWLKVTGIIKAVDYKGEKIPAIIAAKVEEAKKPDNEYVYPY